MATHLVSSARPIIVVNTGNIGEGSLLDVAPDISEKAQSIIIQIGDSESARIQGQEPSLHGRRASLQDLETHRMEILPLSKKPRNASENPLTRIDSTFSANSSESDDSDFLDNGEMFVDYHKAASAAIPATFRAAAASGEPSASPTGNNSSTNSSDLDDDLNDPDSGEMSVDHHRAVSAAIPVNNSLTKSIQI